MTMTFYTCGSFFVEAARDPARLKEAIEADRYWERYLASNSTVMAHTFQVQPTSNSYFNMATSSGLWEDSMQMYRNECKYFSVHGMQTTVYSISVFRDQFD
jgi:hypothetical protein